MGIKSKQFFLSVNLILILFFLFIFFYIVPLLSANDYNSNSSKSMVYSVSSKYYSYRTDHLQEAPFPEQSDIGSITIDTDERQHDMLLLQPTNWNYKNQHN